MNLSPTVIDKSQPIESMDSGVRARSNTRKDVTSRRDTKKVSEYLAFRYAIHKANTGHQQVLDPGYRHVIYYNLSLNNTFICKRPVRLPTGAYGYLIGCKNTYVRSRNSRDRFASTVCLFGRMVTWSRIRYIDSTE